MSFAFYIYTTIIMGVALVTSAVALVVWLMTRRRDSLVAAAGVDFRSQPNTLSG